AAQGRAAPAVRRPDHWLRRLRGIGGDRTACWHFRGGRAALGARAAAAADHRPRGTARAYHWGARRDHPWGTALLPADERQFLAVSAARPSGQGRGWTAAAGKRKDAGEETCAHSAGARRSRALDRGRQPRRGSRVAAMMSADPSEIAGLWRSAVVLKRDPLSTVERGRFATPTGEVEAVLRRVDQVPWWSRVLARHLFKREREALARADGLGIAPPLLFGGRAALVRGFIE